MAQHRAKDAAAPPVDPSEMGDQAVEGFDELLDAFFGDREVIDTDAALAAMGAGDREVVRALAEGRRRVHTDSDRELIDADTALAAMHHVRRPTVVPVILMIVAVMLGALLGVVLAHVFDGVISALLAGLVVLPIVALVAYRELRR